MSRAPLSGIKVLDLTRLLPGPYLTMVLADMGADIVKIEAPGPGDYLRAIPPARAGMGGRFLAINRGKRSLALDLKAEAGRDAFLRLVKGVDAVVESFRPGVLDRLGLGFETLKEHNPGIILLSLSGYGQTGSYRSRAGHDINYMALAGALAMSGERSGAPVLPGLQVADLVGGALWGATALLGALVGRDGGDDGVHLDISMTEGVMALMASEFGNMDAGGEASTRGAGMLNGGSANYAVYRTADDRYLAVGALEPKFWAALNAAIGREVVASDLVPDRAAQDALKEELAGIIAARSRDEWVELLSQHDCCCEPVIELAELRDLELHRERGMFFTIDDDDLGALPQLRTPVGGDAAMRPPPRHGQHSAEVLREHGFEAAEIEQLLAGG